MGKRIKDPDPVLELIALPKQGRVSFPLTELDSNGVYCELLLWVCVYLRGDMYRAVGDFASLHVFFCVVTDRATVLLLSKAHTMD